jgi:hypothetical protein
MNYAFRLTPPGEETLVTIKDMQALGEETARSFSYKCIDRRCGVSIRPIFPKEVRLNAKEAHRPHFRATPKKHAEFCTRDAAISQIEESKADLGQGEKPSYEIVERLNYPVRLRKPRTTEREVERPAPEEKPDCLRRRGGQATLPPGDKQTHFSQSTSSHVRDFAEAFESFPKHHDEMVIDIDFCPARTYAETFLEATEAVNFRGLVKPFHIYRGSYLTHKEHDSGIAILFEGKSGNGKKLGVWIRKELADNALAEEIRNRLRRAKEGRHATIYVLGRFKSHSTWKYTIEIEDIGELWISFPADAVPDH